MDSVDIVGALVAAVILGYVVGVVSMVLHVNTNRRRRRTIAGPRITIQNGSLAGKVIPLENRLFLGKKEFGDNLPDVVLQLVFLKNQWFVMPLVDEIRVFINSAPLEPDALYPLSDNDRIWVGTQTAQFHLV